MYNNDQRDHNQAVVAFGTYLTTGHYIEAVFENWESEFLQDAAYVMLTAYLFQRGSSESKLFSIVTLSIVLRQRGSPESKPVASPHFKTSTG